MRIKIITTICNVSALLLVAFNSFIFNTIATRGCFVPPYQNLKNTSFGSSVFTSIERESHIRDYTPLSFCPSQSINQISSSPSSSSSFNFRKYLLSQKSSPSDSETTQMRAWTCSGRTQSEMVEKLSLAKIVQSPSIKKALLCVDRANYVTQGVIRDAYTDAPQPIGHGQTISAPHMHAHALEVIFPYLLTESDKIRHVASKLDGQKDELKILDVGVGSGYLTATLGRLVNRGKDGPVPPLVKGRVFGIDVIPNLVNLATSNIQKSDQDLFDSGTVSVQVGDGWKGLPSEAPFHAIHVGAAAPQFPEALMMQLKPKGGVMVIPIGPNGGIQQLYRIERQVERENFNKADFDIKPLLGVRYVPLLHP